MKQSEEDIEVGPDEERCIADLVLNCGMPVSVIAKRRGLNIGKVRAIVTAAQQRAEGEKP